MRPSKCAHMSGLAHPVGQVRHSLIDWARYLVLASRSGDERARTAHDGDIVTFHRVRDFRSLVY